MTTPTLHQAVEQAWPDLEELVTEVLGRPKDRALTKIVEIREVPANSRVLVLDVDSQRQDDTPELVEDRYTGNKVTLSHRRYPLSLTEDQLRLLADQKSVDRQPRKKVKTWAQSVLSEETLRLARPLCSTPTDDDVPDPLNPDAVQQARSKLSLNGPSPQPLTLLVAKRGLPDQDLRKSVRNKLAGGPIIDLPVTREQFGCTACVLPHQALDGLHLFVAIDFTLGWNVEDTNAVIHLDRRTSTLEPQNLHPPSSVRIGPHEQITE